MGPATTPKPYTPPEHPQEKINTTDLDSRLVKGMDGWLQGYNAQAALSRFGREYEPAMMLALLLI
jgi:hypothetical protein